MGLISLMAESPFAIFFVLREVSVKISYVRIALECKDVSGDPVEEPTVMADYNGATAEILEGLFKRPHRVYVKVVSGFVKKEDIRPALKDFCQMNPVSFAAR